MPFVGPDAVALELVSDTRWKLLHPLTYEGKTDTYVVPAGFDTDLASVPRALVWLVPRYGRYTRSAILHDYLVTRDDVPKHDADGIFRRSMRELKVPFLQRWMMWGGVGLFSTLRDRGDSMTGPGLLHTLGLILVVVPSAIFVAVPFLVVSVWLVLMALLELVAYPFELLSNLLKPLDEREHVNRPEFLWKLS